MQITDLYDWEKGAIRSKKRVKNRFEHNSFLNILEISADKISLSTVHNITKSIKNLRGKFHKFPTLIRNGWELTQDLNLHWSYYNQQFKYSIREEMEWCYSRVRCPLCKCYYALLNISGHIWLVYVSEKDYCHKLDMHVKNIIERNQDRVIEVHITTFCNIYVSDDYMNYPRDLLTIKQRQLSDRSLKKYGENGTICCWCDEIFRKSDIIHQEKMDEFCNKCFPENIRSWIKKILNHPQLITYNVPAELHLIIVEYML